MLFKIAGLIVMGAAGAMFVNGLETQEAMAALALPISAATAYIMLGSA
jgi:hypothetical protein